VGGAVERNRAKRLLREAFRRRSRGSTIHCDLVVLAKREILGCGQAELDRELARSLEKLEGRLASRGPAGRARTHPAG
jgi:ribonuclease P protein component